MIHLDALASHAPFFVVLAIGIGAIVLLWRWMRRAPAQDHAAVLREAGLYRGPVAARSGEVRER